MLFKADISGYVKEDECFFSCFADCPECLHDSIICGWTVENSDKACSVYRNIVFIKPEDRNIKVYFYRPPSISFKIFFNLYSPNEVKKLSDASVSV